MRSDAIRRSGRITLAPEAATPSGELTRRTWVRQSVAILMMMIRATGRASKASRRHSERAPRVDQGGEP